MRIVCSIDESPVARNAARMAGHLADRMSRARLRPFGDRRGVAHAPARARIDGVVPGGEGFEPPARCASLLLGRPLSPPVRRAGCPVMMVPAAAQLRAGANVVLGYDLPTVSSAEAAFAGRLAGALDASLVVTHVEARGGSSRRTRGRLHEAARRISREASVAAEKRLDVRHVERRGAPPNTWTPLPRTTTAASSWSEPTGPAGDARSIAPSRHSFSATNAIR